MLKLRKKIDELEKELEKRPTYRELVINQVQNIITIQRQYEGSLYKKVWVYVGEEKFRDFHIYRTNFDEDDIYEKLYLSLEALIKFDKKVSEYKKEIEPIRKKYFEGGDDNEEKKV